MRIGRLAGAVGAALLAFSIAALQPVDLGGAGAGGSTLSLRARRETKAQDAAAGAHSLLQRARAEADPTLIPEARALLSRSLSLRPRGNYAALLGMASLSNATHDFTTSVRWARRAIRLNRFAAAPYGVLGDALHELGRYRASERAYQKMIDLRPDVASYVRASYTAQSYGDARGAHRAMRLAIQAGPAAGPEAAWLRHQSGDIYYAERRFRRALAENRLGLSLAPGYAPPRVGIAESLMARGDVRRALSLVESAARDLPSLEYLVTLGDLYSATGRDTAASVAYSDAAAKLRAYRSSGVLPDVDFILIYADRGLRPRAALEEAFAIFKDRPTSAAADALAWMLHSVGRDAEAARFARLALAKQRTPDASAHFHAGVIAHELGKDGRARRHLITALRLNPVFSLPHRAEALHLLGRLEAHERHLRA